MKKKIMYGLLLLLLIGIILMRMTGIHRSINLAFFKTHAVALKSLVEQRYIMSVGIYLFFYILFIACMIPVSPALTIFGGYIFNPFMGSLYATLAATIGATIDFLIVRYFAAHFLKDKMGYQVAAFNEKFNAHGALYVLFLVLLPITPFSVITTVAGISSISLLHFMGAVALGTLPGSYVYAMAGEQLMHITKPSDVFTGKIFWSFMLMALLAFVPMIMERIYARFFIKQ